MRNEIISVRDDPATNLSIGKYYFKIFVYISRGVNESQTMEKIIFQILQVTNEEKDELENVRHKNRYGVRCSLMIVIKQI